MTSRRTCLVVFRTPLRHARALLDADRTVDDDARRRVAVIESGCIDDWLERGAWLPACLRRAIELARCKAEASDDGQYAPGMRIHRNERTTDRRNLLKRPLSLEAVVGRSWRAVRGGGPDARRAIDDVARVKYSADSCQPTTATRAGFGARPFRLVVGNDSRIALLQEPPLRVAAGP